MAMDGLRPTIRGEVGGGVVVVFMAWFTVRSRLAFVFFVFCPFFFVLFHRFFHVFRFCFGCPFYVFIFFYICCFFVCHFSSLSLRFLPKVSRLPEDAWGSSGGDQGPNTGRTLRRRRPQADAAAARGRVVQTPKVGSDSGFFPYA